jgi:hypothetical protein
MNKPNPIGRWLRGRTQLSRQPAGGPATMPVPQARDPLSAIPLRPAKVELRRDPAGSIHLRVCLQVDGWRARLGRWLRYDFSRTVALDAAGTRFFDLVDGERTLRSIAAALAAPLNRSVPESEQAVILYTRDLMRRGFLDLKLMRSQPSTPPTIQSSHLPVFQPSSTPP